MRLMAARLYDERLGEADEAVGQLRAVLEAVPADPEALELLDTILTREGRHADLLEVLDKSTSMFWGAWPRHRDAFFESAIRRDERYLFDQYVENADILSHIACSKYRFVTIAFRGLMVTVVAYVLLLVAA